MNLLARLMNRRRNKSVLERRAALVANGNVIETAERTEFYALIMDELAQLQALYAAKSMDNERYAGGVQFAYELTNRLSAIKSAKDRILEEEAKGREPPMDEQELEPWRRHGGSPHAL